MPEVAGGGSGGWCVPYSWNTYTTTTNLIFPSYTNSSATTGNWHVMTWNGSPLMADRWEPWVAAGVPRPEPDPAERAAAAEARRQQQIQREADRVVAQSRALDLLLAILPEDQHQRFRRDEVFEVIGSCGNLYRIHPGSVGNVHWIRPDGSIGGRLCAHPNMAEHWLPNADVALSQMLALQTDEAAFVRRANVHAGERPPINVVREFAISA